MSGACGCGDAEPRTDGKPVRYEVADPHLGGIPPNLGALTLVVDESAPCLDPVFPVPGCGKTEADA